MGYRVFTDSHGTEWQTWDVVPRLAERRVAQRRRAPAAAPVMERRRVERRVVAGRRPVLTEGLHAGWLCFETRVEKRRLSPIPSDWQRCAIEQLERYCREAVPAARRVIALDVHGLPGRDN